MRSLQTILPLGCMTIILAACGQTAIEEAAERAIERDTGGQADVDLRNDGSMRINTKDGTVELGRSASLPNNWPAAIGTYPGATIVTSAAVTGDNGQPATMMTLTSDDDATSIVSHFKQKITSDNWEITTEVTMGAMTVLSARKDGREFGLQVLTAENTTTATLVISQSN